MNIVKKVSLFIILIVGISSCNIQNGFIQKRKYQKGYHVSLKKKNAAQHDVKQPNETLVREHISDRVEAAPSFKNTEGDKLIVPMNNVDLASEETSNRNTNAKQSKEKLHPFSGNNKMLQRKLRKITATKPVISSNNTASESSTSDNSEILNIILIVILVLLILALIGELLPGLGWLISVIILVLLIYLVLSLLGMI